MNYHVGQIVGHVEASRDYRGVAGSPWFVIRTDPRAENQVAAGLVGRRFTARSLSCRVQVRHGRNQLRSERRPFFPGYVFARVTEHDDQCWRMKAVAGIQEILRCAGSNNYYTLVDREIQKFLQREIADGGSIVIAPEFTIGEFVRVVFGPFRDFNAEISDLKLDDQGRIILLSALVELFGRKTEIKNLLPVHVERL